MSAILDRTLRHAFSEVLEAPVLFRASLSIALGVLASACTVIAPVFLAQLVDGITGAAADGRIAVIAGAYLGLLCAGRLLGHLQAYMYMVGDQALQRRVSQLTIDRLLRLPIVFHLSEKPGTLVQTHQHALQGARMLMSLACASLLPIVVQMTMILGIVAGIFDLVIWLVVLGTIVSYALVFTWSVRHLGSATNAALRKQAEAAGVLSDGLTNIEAVKNNTAEGRISERYRANLSAAERVWRKSFLQRLESGLATTLVFAISFGCSVWLGLERVTASQLSAGEFLLLATYMLQIIGPLEMTGFAVRDLTQGASYLAAWAKVVGADPEDGSQHHEAVLGRPPAIRFSRVSLSYGSDRQVLSEAVIDVPAGGVVAIVGATGAGKTSLLRLLQKHLSVDAGDVTLDGFSIATIDTNALRRRIAVVSQDVVLFNDTLRYNLTFSNPDASDAEIERALRLARLDRFVATLPDGLATVVGERGLKLSGGERQRVAIARAVLRGGDILLLDEATSALDVNTERELVSDLLALSSGCTTLIVTHRLALAAKAAIIFVLEGGRVIEQGTHEQLLILKGAYAALWAVQADLGKTQSSATLGPLES